MVEYNLDKNFSCKLCPDDDTEKTLCRANCIGCEDVFCVDHLIEHRKDLTNDINQLIQQHESMKKNSIHQLNLNQHLEFIDKWEDETIELIQKHTRDTKEKIRTIFNTYTSELEQYYSSLGTELHQRRDSNHFFEQDIKDLSQQIEQLNKEIQHVKSLLHNISVNELNQIVNKYKQLNTTEKSLRWNYSHEIKLDSTYGYMAASDHHILLGWKNRLVIYNIDGIKHDESRLQSLETYGELCDLIWSSTMNSFYILCRKSLFIHHPLSNQVETLSDISLIKENNQFLSITSCQNSLIILNEKSLDIWKYDKGKYFLNISILISFILKNLSEENICCIRSNDDNLGILIQNTQTHTWHLDIYKFYPFQRLHIGKSFDRFIQPNLGLILSFPNQNYLFMNWETKFMRIIDQNGSHEIIDYNAYNACLLGSQRMLIVNYMTHLKVYKF